MTDLKTWLRAQIAAVDSIRTTGISRAGYLIAQTWSGALIHVHILETLPKTRAIKRIISENSRVGIGTLFLLNSAAVPADGTTVTPDEALIALHALLRDKIYTYRIDDDDQPRIGQVHLRAFNNRGQEREVWYGPDIPIRNLPSFRVWVTHPHPVRGDWLMATFGSEAFWKQPDYTAGRDAFRREQRRASSDGTQHYTWSQAGWNEGGANGYRTQAPPPPETELDRSYKQLGLTRAASGDDVKSAFRRIAREVHPDVSALPKDEAERRFKAVCAAYTHIKQANGW